MAQQITISGKLTFKGDPPTNLPDTSHLKVQFQDTSRACAPSITLGTFKQDIKDYKAGTPLTYSITVEKPKPARMWYSVSAVLNVGWVPQEGGDDWLRNGDYLNDTSHNVDIEEGINEYHKDIEVIHYLR